ncbi:MAG: hypothetical protein R2867_31125 [Caldilineaceae bacterium]
MNEVPRYRKGLAGAVGTGDGLSRPEETAVQQLGLAQDPRSNIGDYGKFHTSVEVSLRR